MLEFKGYEGHIILLCKGHYDFTDVSFLESIRKIWASRCGYNYEAENFNGDLYIANELFKIIQQCLPDEMSSFHEIIHKNIEKSWYKELTAIEKLIMVYQSEIWGISIKDNDTLLIKLPELNKEHFQKIIEGNGKHKDYKLIEN